MSIKTNSALRRFQNNKIKNIFIALSFFILTIPLSAEDEMIREIKKEYISNNSKPTGKIMMMAKELSVRCHSKKDSELARELIENVLGRFRQENIRQKLYLFLNLRLSPINLDLYLPGLVERQYLINLEEFYL